MIRRYLDNYKEFGCIAAACPDTCCSGWLIEIDEESLDRFSGVSKSDSDFEGRVNFSDGCFFQAPNKDCAFLLESGLCKMQKEYGENMLCYTCDMYPRHIEEFPNVREYSLSASCPVVAKDIVGKTDYISFVEEIDGEPDPDSIDEYEDYNDLLYDKLLIIRERIVAVLKGEGSFDEKSDIILNVMSSVQESLDLGMYDGVEKAFDDCESYERSGIDLFADYLSDLEIMDTLEPLRDEFVSWMRSAYDEIGKSADKYDEFEKVYSKVDLIQCNIALYFIFTYFCGAVYDNYVYSAARLAIYSARVIKLLSFAKWCETGKVDIDIIIYKFCRELEHSNDNLNLIKQELDLQ